MALFPEGTTENQGDLLEGSLTSNITLLMTGSVYATFVQDVEVLPQLSPSPLQLSPPPLQLSPTPLPPVERGGNDDDVGLIVGATLGSVFGVVAIIVLVVVMIGRRKHSQHVLPSHQQNTSSVR